MRPQWDHEPKQRKDRIDNDESLLRENRRRCVTDRSQCQRRGLIWFKSVPRKATAAYLSVKQIDIKRGKEGTQTQQYVESSVAAALEPELAESRAGS
jgi:hypothetical protein